MLEYKVTFKEIKNVIKQSNSKAYYNVGMWNITNNFGGLEKTGNIKKKDSNENKWTDNE